MSVVSVNCKECGSISVYCECVKRREACTCTTERYLRPFCPVHTVARDDGIKRLLELATRNKWIEYAKESEASLLRNKGQHTIVKA